MKKEEETYHFTKNQTCRHIVPLAHTGRACHAVVTCNTWKDLSLPASTGGKITLRQALNGLLNDGDQPRALYSPK